MSSILYLSRADVERVALDMPTILDLLERAFREKAAGQVEMPPKPGIHTQPEAFIHAMLAYIPALRSAGIKWVSGYPENQKHGLPYISGLLVLNDVETGIPYAVMDCTWITAYRTGAASALAAKYLARPDSKVAAILACGVQGRTNLEALAAVFRLKTVYAFDIRPEVQKRYVEEMTAKLHVEIIGVDEPKGRYRKRPGDHLRANSEKSCSDNPEGLAKTRGLRERRRFRQLLDPGSPGPNR